MRKRGELRALLRMDMLEAVSRLASGSSCFMLSGVDGDVSGIEAYNRVLATEIHRATRPNGIVLTFQHGVYAGDIVSFLMRLGFRLIDSSSLTANSIDHYRQALRIFEKVI